MAVPTTATATTSAAHPTAAPTVARAVPLGATTPAPTAPPVTVAPPVAPAAAGAVLAASAPAAPTAPASPAAPAPHAQRNLLTGPHGLDAVVGPAYTDCTGLSEVPHDVAVIDTCHTTAILFVGHNRGVFTPLLSYAVGDVIAWHDAAGTLHHLRVVAVRNVSSSVFPPAIGTYEFQTCLYPTGTSALDHDLDAVEV